MDNQRPDLKELLTALCKAQSEYPDIPKTKEGQEGHRKFKYADLNDIHKATRQINAKHGLSTPHMTTDTHLVTTLYHAPSGQSLTTSMPVKFGENQKHNAATLTYVKRQNIQCLLDISTEEDLDAVNTSEEKPKGDEKPRTPQQNNTPQKPAQKNKPGNTGPLGKIEVGAYTGKTFDEVLKEDSVRNYPLARWASKQIENLVDIHPCYVLYCNYCLAEGVDL